MDEACLHDDELNGKDAFEAFKKGNGNGELGKRNLIFAKYKPSVELNLSECHNAVHAIQMLISGHLCPADTGA